MSKNVSVWEIILRSSCSVLFSMYKSIKSAKARPLICSWSVHWLNLTNGACPKVTWSLRKLMGIYMGI